MAAWLRSAGFNERQLQKASDGAEAQLRLRADGGAGALIAGAGFGEPPCAPAPEHSAPKFCCLEFPRGALRSQGSSLNLPLQCFSAGGVSGTTFLSF